MIVFQEPDIGVEIFGKKDFKPMMAGVYSNYKCPTDKDKITDYDIAAEIELYPELWQCGQEANFLYIKYPELDFYFEDEKLYGYLVFLKENNKLIYSEFFQGAPFVFPPGGGSLDLTLKIQVNT